MITEDDIYIHDYNLTPVFKTPSEERRLHYDHSFAMNEAREYINEFSRMDYESEIGRYRVRFMLRENVYERRNPHKINVIERVGRRLKNLPCQDYRVVAMTEKIRDLWILLSVCGKYYGTSGLERAENKKYFYELLSKFITNGSHL